MAAANTTLKVNVDTTDAQRSLSALQSKFETLKTAILGVGFATAIAQANNYANAIKDVSTASDQSISTVVALGKAFAYNGGTADGAQQAILKFSQSLGDAINGSDSAQKAFAAAGITLDDIFNKSQQENLNQYITNLGRMENSALRTKNQIEILGRSAKGVDFGGGVQSSMAASPVTAADIAAIQSGAAASENMKRQFSDLTQALLNVAKPLNDIVAGINVGVKAFESLIKALVLAGSALLIYTKLLPALQTGTNVGYKAIVGMGGAVAFLSKEVASIVGHFTRMIGHLGRVITNTGQAGSRMASFALAISQALKLFLRFAGLAGIIFSIAQAFDFLIQKIFNVGSPIEYLIKKFKELTGIGQDKTQVVDDGTTDMINEQIKAMEAAKVANEEARQRREKMAVEIRKVGDAYAYNNDQQLQAIALETRLIGKTEEEQQLIRGLANIYQAADDQIKGLLETRAQWLQGTEEQKRNIDLIDAQVERIKKLRDAQQKDFVEYTNIQQGRKMMEEDRIRQVENLTKAIEQQTVRTQALGQAQLAIIAKSQEVDFAKTLAGLTPFQAQIAQIQEDARRAALEAGRAYAGAFEDSGDGLTPERAAELTQGLNDIAEGYKKIADQQIANLQQSRTFADGWKSAFEQYADAAYNASEQAKTQFATATKGMEDALINFAKTGKLEWRGFLGSIIEELLRSNIRQLITQAFGGGGKGGSGGLFGALLGGGGGGGGGGFFDSIKGFFSGFFANGGTIPSGSFGVVGERGPELVSGPAQVTPMGASTNITYNINAVDASSFRSLVAQDPEFIFAVTEQGRRRQPGQRR